MTNLAVDRHAERRSGQEQAVIFERRRRDVAVRAEHSIEVLLPLDVLHELVLDAVLMALETVGVRRETLDNVLGIHDFCRLAGHDDSWLTAAICKETSRQKTLQKKKRVEELILARALISGSEQRTPPRRKVCLPRRRGRLKARAQRTLATSIPCQTGLCERMRGIYEGRRNARAPINHQSPSESVPTGSVHDAATDLAEARRRPTGPTTRSGRRTRVPTASVSSRID
jgi:hypothetical protein